MDLKLQLNILEKKVDRILGLLENKELSISSTDKCYSIQIGQLTDEELIRFNLGPYLKERTPDSISV